MNVRIVGRPDPESDAAVARFLARFLEREHPGTVWRSGEGLGDGRPPKAPTRQVDVGADGVDDEGPVRA